MGLPFSKIVGLPPQESQCDLFNPPWLWTKSKALFAVLIILAGCSILGSCANVWASEKAGGLRTSAPIFVLLDGRSGIVLAEKDANKPFNPGDMAKLMVAEVVFDALARKTITLDTEYEISDHAWQRGRGGTMFALLKGRIRVEDLLRGITVLSADDGAIALAEGLAVDEDSFTRIMNKRAQSIGLKGTLFSNSTGTGEGRQHINARDLARLGWVLSTRYPEFYRLYGEKSFTWSKIGQLNRNPLLLRDIGADGIKAARGTKDGFALIGAAEQNGKRLIVVVANLETVHSATEEAHRLLRWGFDNFAPHTLFDTDEVIASAKVYGGQASSVPLHAHGPVSILWRDGGEDRLAMRVDYKGPLIAPVRKGMRVGTLDILKNGVLVYSVPVYTAADVAGGTLQQQAFSAAEELSGRVLRVLWQRTQELMKKRS